MGQRSGKYEWGGGGGVQVERTDSSAHSAGPVKTEDMIYLSLHCHHQNDSCIKMDSDESQLSVPLTVSDKVTRQCPQ